MRNKLICFICCTIFCAGLVGCNAPETETEPGTEIQTETYNTVVPLPNMNSVQDIDNCTVAVSFEQGDVYVDDTGAMQMDVTVYTYDLYDMVDIAELKEGDVIVIRGEEVIITSLEQTERGLLINGGLDENGYDLRTSEDTVWYESGYSDVKSYYEIGKVTLRVSPDMCFYDNFDLDKGECTYYPGDFLVENTDFMYYFNPNNTTIVIEDGMIIEMHRQYTP